MRLGDVPEGQKVILLDEEYEVVRQSFSGTVVRKTKRIEKTVKGRDGQVTARFGSKAKPMPVSSECAVTLVTD